jgi:hypothetical protein
MILTENYGKLMKGEFLLIARNKNGEIIYTYEDKNVVVNDARPTTAYSLSRAMKTGANRPEYDGDGYDLESYKEELMNISSFQIAFIKMGGGFPRKRSYCNSLGEEIPLVPTEFKNGMTRSSLYSHLDFGTTLTDTVPANWSKYGLSSIQQPYNTSSLLYPRKTDKDIVDRDYQWSKRILKYSYTGTPTSTGFRADFTTTMRFEEGNGPAFTATGNTQGVNRLYEYREAGLYVGIMPWLYKSEPVNEYNVQSELAAARNEHAVYGDFFGASNVSTGTIDSALTNNLREYRYWDGHSELMNASWGGGGLPQWPKYNEGSYIWESSLKYRNAFKSKNDTTTNTDLQGELFEGWYMVARKTFPVISKTRDLEFTIKWSLVFG